MHIPDLSRNSAFKRNEDMVKPMTYPYYTATGLGGFQAENGAKVGALEVLFSVQRTSLREWLS